MNNHLKDIAQKCLHGAAYNTMSFPQIVETLILEGFESYVVDFRRKTVTYYLKDGQSIEFPKSNNDHEINSIFDTNAIKSAIQEAQQLVEGYTYKSFCEKLIAAGCVSYIVSFLGNRTMYFGRTAETHTEYFPQPKD